MRQSIHARLRRLEATMLARETRKPSVEELRAEARGEPVRPVVADLAEKMRAYGREIDAATVGFCPWPRGR